MRRSVRITSLAAVTSLIAAPAAFAQSPPAAAATTVGKGVVVGTVYDSIGARPLAGAEVRLDGTEYTATTNAQGAFRIAGVPAGDYVIAVDHPEFDSLGVGLPYGHVRVPAGDSIGVTLATPSIGAVARGLCAGLGTDTAGVVLGAVRRVGVAGSDAPLAGARVAAGWVEWVPAGSELRRVERTIVATSDASGFYRLCGTPNDVAVRLTATAPARAGVADVRTGSASVDLHGGVVTIRDLLVRIFAADSVAGTAARADGATLALRVLDDAGLPIAGAQLRAAGRDAPVGVSDHGGELRAGDLPAGSQSFQLLALGYAPTNVSAELRTARTTTSIVHVGPRVATQLSEVRVVARGSVWDRSGFEERRRTGQGHYLTADDVRRRQPTMFTQLVVTQLGFTVAPTRLGNGYSVSSSRGGSTSQTCPVQYFVDGVPVATAATQTIDDVVNPMSIRGVEFYPGIGTVPARFTLAGRNACGTIVIWTGANGASSAATKATPH